MLIDTHVHLNLLLNDQSTCFQLSIRTIVPATTATHWQRIQTLALSPTVYPAYGLHPWFSHNQADLDKLERIATNGIAIGECGLDKKLSAVDFNVQLDYLHAQLAIAQNTNLPVILHCVKAGNAMLKALRTYPSLRGVVHGYSGSVQEAKAFLDQGFYLGIPHSVANPKATRLHNVFRDLPSSALLVESDAPNKMFKDINVYQKKFRQSIKDIALHLNLDAAELIAVSNRNACELFKI